MNTVEELWEGSMKNKQTDIQWKISLSRSSHLEPKIQQWLGFM